MIFGVKFRVWGSRFNSGPGFGVFGFTIRGVGLVV